MDLIKKWFADRFSDPQMVILALVVTLGVLLIFFFGKMLAPVLAALVIAYLLEGMVKSLQKTRLPRTPAVYVVFFCFMLLVTLGVMVLLPLLTRQIAQFLNQVPSMISLGQEQLLLLPQRYPQLVSEKAINAIMDSLRAQMIGGGQFLLSYSLTSLINIIAFLVYIILVPLLIFFFLKDKSLILAWLARCVPSHTELTAKVWSRVNFQIANYIRGKVWEVLIVWFASYVAFALLKLNFAMLLSLTIGLSVLIPYVGATVVTIPVALVAFSQFGWTSQLATVMIVYGVIQALDGNLLVPVLLGEVVQIHPIAVIVSILVFGGIFGFWGVFFAIPLAVLVNALLTSFALRCGTEDTPSGNFPECGPDRTP